MIVHIVHASLPRTVFIRDGHIVNSLVGVLAPHEVVDDLLELQQLPRRGPVLHRHLGPAVELVAGPHGALDRAQIYPYAHLYHTAPWKAQLRSHTPNWSGLAAVISRATPASSARHRAQNSGVSS